MLFLPPNQQHQSTEGNKHIINNVNLNIFSYLNEKFTQVSVILRLHVKHIMTASLYQSDLT